MLFLFADHTLDTDRRELLRGSEPVAVEPQVFDLVIYLLANRDRVVSKDDLIAAVWGGRVVSESTLSSRINAARKAVGDNGAQQRLMHIARKGIRFVGAVRTQSRGAAAPPPDVIALSLPDRPAIAVLPFINMSGDPDQEYFADGLTEDIITGLSRQHWFFVIARNSTFTYKGRSVDVREVAAQLGVRYILKGSVRKAANRVRVTSQLIDVTNSSHLWAEKYDRELTDIFALQDDITNRVIGSVGPQVLVTEAALLKERRRKRQRLGFGHAGGAAHVAHEYPRACASAGAAAAGHCTRCQLRPCARFVGMDLCDHVQSGHQQADR